MQITCHSRAKCSKKPYRIFKYLQFFLFWNTRVPPPPRPTERFRRDNNNNYFFLFKYFKRRFAFVSVRGWRGVRARGRFRVAAVAPGWRVGTAARAAVNTRPRADGPPLDVSAHGRKVLHAFRPTRTLVDDDDGIIVAQKFCHPPAAPPREHATAYTHTHTLYNIRVYCTARRRARYVVDDDGWLAVGEAYGVKVSKRFFIEQTPPPPPLFSAPITHGPRFPGDSRQFFSFSSTLLSPFVYISRIRHSPCAHLTPTTTTTTTIFL